MLYWLHRPDELNMFDSGYVGVTENLPARMRCRKHKFKGAKLQPFAGYAFERKGWVKS